MDQPVLVVEERSIRRRALTGVVLAAAGVGLIWVLRLIEWKEFVADLVFIDWKWVVPAVAFDILSYVVQAVRWNYVLKPLGSPSLVRSTQAIYVDRKSTRLNSSHIQKSRMPSSA